MEFKISEEWLKKFMETEYLVNCGTDTNLKYDFDYVVVKTEEKALKQLTSTKWENTLWNKYQDVGAYMSVHHRQDKELDAAWNKLAKQWWEARDEFRVHVEKYVKNDERFKLLCDEIVNVTGFFLQTYALRDYCKSEFLMQVIEVYLSGHLPCGWKGTYANGKLMVY